MHLKNFGGVWPPLGVIIVTVPFDTERQRRFSPFPQEEKGEKVLYFQYFMTNKELEKYVEDAGFVVLESGLCGGPTLALLAPAIYERYPPATIIGKFLNLS